MHKTFLSYHHANEQDLKDEIIKNFGGANFIDKSVSDGDISTTISEESIMRKIREDYLDDTTVTIVLIGSETKNRPFVNSEIQASLWGENYNGLIGVIRDEIYDSVFTPATCLDGNCGCGLNLRKVGWGYNNYLPYLIKENHVYQKTVPHYNDTDVFCSLVKYSKFIKNPEFYIDQAFDKRKAMEPAVKRNAADVPAIRA
ncbi:TIR domain-containing protein [Pantoea sp. CS_6]|uniref:TIR domain-containing protein n=1 Tax=unclassified Pantoea TaxID=2630326 RepID=UPI0035BF69A5